jgi:hypothetical protein
MRLLRSGQLAAGCGTLGTLTVSFRGRSGAVVVAVLKEGARVELAGRGGNT